MKTEPGILVENYSPVTKENFDEYLFSVKDSVKTYPANVFFKAANLQEIDPLFKKRYFWYWGSDQLKWNQNDSTRLLNNTFLCMGVFDGKKICEARPL